MSLLTKIRELCSSKGLTLAELERLAGLSPNTLRRWDTSTPSVDKVEAIANFFHVSVDYLLERDVKDESEFILARKLQQTEGLTKSDKEYLLNQIEQTIDIYLKAKGLI